MDKTSIYKLDSKGKERIWTIWVEGNKDSLTAPATIRIESGLIEGKKVPETIPITSGKNLGKANATSPYTQAVSQAEAKLEKKLKGEYVKDLKDAKQGVVRSGIGAPMKAHKYDPTGKQSNSKTLEKMKIEGHTIHVQPKYDGYRYRVGVDSANEVTFYGSSGDVVESIPHIEEQLKALALGEILLDGEMFSDVLEFNDLGGLLRRQTKTAEDYDKLKSVYLKIYDIVSDKHYQERYEMIKKYASKDIRVIDSYEITATEENINEKLEKFLADGHEGLMIRTLDKGYENKRTWQLVKCKLFEDAEFEIVDFTLNSQGRLGNVVCKLGEPTTDRDGKVVTTFDPGLGKGISHEEGMKLYNNKAKYIGKMATIEFFGKSKYNIPRFPKFKSVREDI